MPPQLNSAGVRIYIGSWVAVIYSRIPNVISPQDVGTSLRRYWRLIIASHWNLRHCEQHAICTCSFYRSSNLSKTVVTTLKLILCVCFFFHLIILKLKLCVCLFFCYLSNKSISSWGLISINLLYQPEPSIKIKSNLLCIQIWKRHIM